MSCNCNGSTVIDFISLVPGGTAANSTYQVGLTHYTCGNRKMCTENPARPVLSSLEVLSVGTPQDLGNNTYCCEIQLAGTIKYCPLGQCAAREEYVVQQFCIPCNSATAPTVTLGNVLASPVPVTYLRGCCPDVCPYTNKVALTTSINVTTA